MATGILFDTAAEYELEIVEVRLAIRRVLGIGQKNQNTSGGSTRAMEDANLEDLYKYLRVLRKELAAMSGKGPIKIKARW